jgi:protein-disulfide isomerase
MAKKSRNQTSRSSGSGGDHADHEARTGARADSRRAQRVLEERQAKRRKIYTMFGGAAAAALILVLILVIISREDDGGMAAEPVTPPRATYTDIPRDGRTLGDPGAPVQIVEYGDYQCPACANFAMNVKPQLINEYIATGQVFFEYRDLTGLGRESLRAAEAAACALEQDMYWEYHDTLYANLVGRNDGGFSDPRLIRMAEQLEMDTDAFEDCLDDDRHGDEIEAMAEQARQDNVRATPTLIVNGVLLEGPSFDALRQQIESALQSR